MKMQRKVKNFIALVLTFVVLCTCMPVSAEEISVSDSTSTDTRAHITYQTHVQSYGWQPMTEEGNVSGTEGKSKRLEGIRIELDKPKGVSGDIEYRTHIQTTGWEDFWHSSNEISGTVGKSKRLEAIQIRLTGQMAELYDVYYQVHAQTYGWLDWAKNGEKAGTSGESKRLEAIRIRLVEKGDDAPGSTVEPYKFTKVTYTTHVQTYGWMSTAKDGETSGTEGESKRLEAIRIQLNNAEISGGIEYRTHVQTYGWEEEWRQDGELSGTQGESKRLEAIEIRLTGEAAEKYDIYYRTHAQTYGWLGWAKNGESAGTSRLSRRLEAIQIQLVKKGQPAPGSEENAFLTSEWNTQLIQQGESTLVNVKTTGADQIQQYGTEASVKVTAAIKYNNNVIRQVEKEVSLTGLPEVEFQMDFGNYAKYYVTVEYKVSGVTVETQQQVFGVTASEYNLAPVSATLPVLYFSLSLWDINVSDTTGNPVPTIVMLTRASAYDWDNLPDNVYGMPYMTDEQLHSGSDHIIYANYVKDLYEMNPESKFHLYINDIDCSVIQWIIYANQIPEGQYTITMMSDGSATYSIMNDTYGVEDPQAKHQELIQTWNEAKAEAYETGTWTSDWGWHSHWDCMYAVLSCEPGTQWWVAKNNLFTSGDDNVFAEQLSNDVTVKNVNTMLQNLTAKGDETVEQFKSLYNFNDEYFTEAEQQGKQVMLLLGTYVSNEKNFEDYAELTKLYYGDDYMYYYKGHPNTPTGLYPEKQEELDRLNITDVDSSVAAELILFFNPDIRLTGYGSSTFNSTSEEMACGLFDMTKETALSPDSSVDYSGIDWFASYIDKSAVDSSIAQLAPNDRCYLVELSDEVIAETTYDIGIYDAQNQILNFYSISDDGNYTLEMTKTE